MAQTNRETYNFVLRIWRYRRSKEGTETEWYGEIEPVREGYDSMFFKGLDQIVRIVRQMVGEGISAAGNDSDRKNPGPRETCD